jgi:cytochrome c-type biogenesis protein CcmH
MGSVLILGAIFAVLALLAAFFACWPILRATNFRLPLRLLLVGLAVSSVFAVGGGLYILRGTPSLALRSLRPVSPNDVPGLIAALAHRAREKSFNATGWVWLGRGYLSLGDAGDAAAAFRRAIQTAAPQDRPGLLSAYGEALTIAASGAVTSEAEAAFREALAGNPKDFAARYYLGLDYAGRGDAASALKYWQGLLADLPADAPGRGELLDHIARLRAQSGGAPDISAMVAGLAARLQAKPNDPEGWQRLVRAYVVLGEQDKARAALTGARTALKGDASALAALREEAVSLKLD